MAAPARTTSLLTERLRIEFGAVPFTVHRIVNRCTGQPVCLDGNHSFLIRTAADVSEPIFLNCLRSCESSAEEIRFIITDAGGKYTVRLSVTEVDGEVCFRMNAVAPRPIWMVEWRLSGLRVTHVIVPALGGQSIGRGMPVGGTLSYKYPFWWNAQFVIGRTEGGGIWVHTRNAAPAFALLRVTREKAGFAITYGCEATAPLVSNSLAATWYLDAFRGSWKVPVEAHRKWMEKAFGLRPLSENSYAPEWMKDIDFVLELWGMRKDQPRPHHTFDEMKRRIVDWAKLHPPEHTLLYLPGFANQGIDSKAPNYDPSIHLGGEKKFAEVVALARTLGYRVMIHTNVLAMTYSHPLFPKFKQHQVHDAFGRPMSWDLDMDGDWLAEPYFAYINPGVKAWGDLMIGILGKLIAKYRLDGVFIDQTLLAFNNSSGPNFLSGMRMHIERLHRAFPHVLFAGEGLHEQVVQQLPMAQIHGIDSIREVHTPEERTAWRQVHPVSVYLFGGYTRFVPHLLTRHPSHPMFKFQDRAYSRIGILPALCLYDAAQKMDMPEVRNMIRRATAMRHAERRSPSGEVLCEQ